MNYPSNVVYQRLYARYLKPERIHQMLELAGDLKGRNILDLCGGAGELAVEAWKRGAGTVQIVDSSFEMTRPNLDPSCRGALQIINKDVGSYLKGQQSPLWDVAFCKQAVNYWLDEFSAKDLGNILRPGGTFVFNTFNQCPDTVPIPKTYTSQGRRYVEMSWLTDKSTIQHVQICEGMPPHTTSFWWISPEEFDTLAEAGGFDSEVIVDHATSIYRWTKK